MADAPPRALLPAAELELLRRLARGSSMRQAAAEMNYSYSYARQLAASAARKLGARNSIQAVYLAARHHLI